MSTRFREGASIAIVATLVALNGCGNKPADPAAVALAGGAKEPVAAVPLQVWPYVSIASRGVTLKLSSHSAHAIGRFDPATGGIRSSKGEVGALHFGPDIQLAPGAYRATFEVRAEGQPVPVGKVDVSLFPGTAPESILGTATILGDPAGRPATVTVDFHARPDKPHDFRVFSNGEGALEISGIRIMPR